jgi:hypothetical protein
MAVTLNLTPEVHRELQAIGKGNRSAAVELLVQWYLHSQPIAVKSTQPA